MFCFVKISLDLLLQITNTQSVWNVREKESKATFNFQSLIKQSQTVSSS